LQTTSSIQNITSTTTQRGFAECIAVFVNQLHGYVKLSLAASHVESTNVSLFKRLNLAVTLCKYDVTSTNQLTTFDI
jgi:hypothetical protein